MRSHFTVKNMWLPAVRTEETAARAAISFSLLTTISPRWRISATKENTSLNVAKTVHLATRPEKTLPTLL